MGDSQLFENLIGGDEATFGRFRDHFRRIVETVLPQSRFEVREAEGNGDDGQAPNPSDPPSADPPAECDAEELTGRLEALIRDCTTFLGVDDLARFVASADPGWGNVDGLLGNADLIWRMADNLELPRPPAPPIGRGNRSVAADVVRHLASWAQARLSEVRAKAADALSEEQAKAGMTWQKVAERMNRLRTQGEPWTSHDEMAKRFDCSTGTTCKAVKNTPELQNWAKRQNGAAPRTQSIIDLVTDRTKQKRELNPRDEAAIREYLEQDDLPADARAFFHSLSTEDQLAFLDDPDDYRKILGRKS